MQENTSIGAKKRILVTVLNWGLGHAARCVPLIQALQAADHNILLAADGRAGLLLQKEFPELTYLALPSYNIRYGSSNMILNIAWQWPKILQAGLREHWKIREIVTKYQIDLIISDSRFGCYHPNVKSIFVTHQLWIRTPFPFLSFIVNQFNHWVIRKYDECWIPDWPEEPRLAAELSRPIPNLVTRYLGPLSRMTVGENQTVSFPLVVILSGPEPQRSRFEQMVLRQAKDLNQAVLLIQGKAEDSEKERTEGPISMRPFAAGKELNKILAQANLVLCRSGYSSIMDLVRLGKRAILVPTPGQTEQEYLAQVCQEKGWFYSQTQNQFNLQKAMEASIHYHPEEQVGGKRKYQLKEVVGELLARLES